MVSAPAMTSARMIGDGLAKSFVSWWLGVRKNLEHHAEFTHHRFFCVVAGFSYPLAAVTLFDIEFSVEYGSFIPPIPGKPDTFTVSGVWERVVDAN